MPLILTRGWLGSALEFRHVIDPLINPAAHGGCAEDAFHVVIPSMPGFGFSGKSSQPGWNPARIADAWATLMARLDYNRWGRKAAIGSNDDPDPRPYGLRDAGGVVALPCLSRDCPLPR